MEKNTKEKAKENEYDAGQSQCNNDDHSSNSDEYSSEQYLSDE